ncbi:MAG: YraN family protein [SAR324 cluster bacterium]|nr:YraN family protein [SAR324 cluster bacterium]MBF0350036.1 YraN family protein [SAR324 cluster bacterium]
MAVMHLEQKHYQIIETNFRCVLGEIDIIAAHEEYLIFCEVKTRSGREIHPSLSVTRKKQTKLHQLGLYFINQRKLFQLQPRFDVISVQYSGNSPVIEHFINAF